MGLENPLHIAILLIIVLVVFGAKRLPEMGRSLGEGMRGFKDTLSGDSSSNSQPLPPAQSQQPPVAQPAAPAAQPDPPPPAAAPPQPPLATSPEAPPASEQPANK